MNNFDYFKGVEKENKGYICKHSESPSHYLSYNYDVCTTRCTNHHQQTGQPKSSSQWFSVQIKTS